jgi:hypothetical protein
VGVLRRLSTWLRGRRAAPERATDVQPPPRPTFPDDFEWPDPWSSAARAYPPPPSDDYTVS